MKKLILLVLGLTPFLFGGIQNGAMWTVFYDGVFPSGVFGVIVLAIWCFFAYQFSPWASSPKQAVILLNLPAALVLVLVGIQELILQAYWMGAVGLWTQYFFLPVLHLGFLLTMWAHRVFPAYCAGFALMVGASVLGCYLRKKRELA